MPNTFKKISSFKKSEISELFKRARVAIRCSGIRILTAQSKNKAGRILIVTPRTCGNSPQRNLFRRRIKAIFRENNLATHSKDFVIIVDKRGIATPFDKLRRLLLCAISEQK